MERHAHANDAARAEEHYCAEQPDQGADTNAVYSTIWDMLGSKVLADVYADLTLEDPEASNDTRLAVMIGRAQRVSRCCRGMPRKGLIYAGRAVRTAEYGTAHAGSPGHLDGPQLAAIRAVELRIVGPRRVALQEQVSIIRTVSKNDAESLSAWTRLDCDSSAVNAAHDLIRHRPRRLSRSTFSSLLTRSRRCSRTIPLRT